ncbi:MAG TPA: hypothetical protein VK435_04580 [Thermodesulfovibrionales bacterium]|nr:hypothetical protein [Thermodesulfovibrionales bacterium]
MPYRKIKVISYSGYRCDERPQVLFIDGRKIIPVEILDMWIEEGLSDRARRRFFIVRTESEERHKICLDEKTGEWFCEM